MVFVLLGVDATLIYGCGIWEHLHSLGKWNVSNVIPRLYGWVYKTWMPFSLAVEYSVAAMTAGFQSTRSQIVNLCSESVGA